MIADTITGAPFGAHDSLLLATAAAVMIGLVVAITFAKAHPFVALVVASGTLGLAAGLPPEKAIGAFQKGVGDTLGNVGVVIALGAMLGKLLEASGGAHRLVSRWVGEAGSRALPWAMAAAAMLIGIPMFFEVGVVLVMPVILLVARRTGQSTLRIGIPALAGLSVLHGLVPPHPAPLVAASLLGADVGRTLGFGLLVALPTVAVAGPLFGNWIGRRIRVEPDASPSARDSAIAAPLEPPRGAPGIATTLATLLLPVALMMLRAAADVVSLRGPARGVLDFVGHPVVALLAAVLVATVTFGFARGMDRGGISALLGESLGPIAAVVLIVGAGGGFKETLVQSGVGAAIGRAAAASSLPPLLLGWLIAVGIRVATGSATVATVTASGILAPIAPTLSHADPSLMALAIGCGSLFFSHVNDAGFWLIKEYFGLSLAETFASWSVMETLISVLGLFCVLGLAAIAHL